MYLNNKISPDVFCIVCFRYVFVHCLALLNNMRHVKCASHCPYSLAMAALEQSQNLMSIVPSRGSAWGNQETLDLLDIWRTEKIQYMFEGPISNTHVYGEIAKLLKERDGTGQKYKLPPK